MTIKSLKVSGLLSYRDAALELRPLNVLVGANSAGKSNLIELLALLQAIPQDLAPFLRERGGRSGNSWFHIDQSRTDPARQPQGTLEVEAVLAGPAQPPQHLHYALTLADRGFEAAISSETLAETGRHPAQRLASNTAPDQFSPPASLLATDPTSERTNRRPDRSAADRLAETFSAIRLYRTWNTGRSCPARWPRAPEHRKGPEDPEEKLQEDLSNLAPALRRVCDQGQLDQVNTHLQQFCESYAGVEFSTQYQDERQGEGDCPRTQLAIREKTLLRPTPVAQLSGSTVKFLALLAVLADPDPPPLLAIEEPSAGLHPDLIHLVSRLLAQAAEHTQIVVTTHSPELLDQLWEQRDCLVTCDNRASVGTTLTRHGGPELDEYLERYSLGDLWRTGLLGGNRY